MRQDWEKHENREHYQVETWRCQEYCPSSKIEQCATIFHRYGDFVQHLLLKHQVEDKVIEGKSSECHVGRNGQDRFWCGFCIELIKLEYQGLDAWNERYGHIEQHIRMGTRVRDNWYPINKDIPTDYAKKTMDVSKKEEADHEEQKIGVIR